MGKCKIQTAAPQLYTGVGSLFDNAARRTGEQHQSDDHRPQRKCPAAVRGYVAETEQDYDCSGDTGKGTARQKFRFHCRKNHQFEDDCRHGTHYCALKAEMRKQQKYAGTGHGKESEIPVPVSHPAGKILTAHCDRQDWQKKYLAQQRKQSFQFS